MSQRLSVTSAKERLRSAALAFARLGNEENLYSAALQFAAAKRRRNDSRDAWKLKHRLDGR